MSEFRLNLAYKDNNVPESFKFDVIHQPKKDTTRRRREGRESEAMKTKSAKVLPKTAQEITNGGVYRQRVRCGKANCKCANGGDHHTAFYFFTRRQGKLIKLYIPKAQVENFAGIVKQAAIDRRRRRQAVNASVELLAKFRAELSGNAGTISRLRENRNYE